MIATTTQRSVLRKHGMGVLCLVALLLLSCGGATPSTVSTSTSNTVDFSFANQQISSGASSNAATWNTFLKSSAYAGQLVVKFDPAQGKVRLRAGQLVNVDGSVIAGLEKFSTLFPGVKITRRMEGMSEDEVDTFRTKYAARGVQLHDWNQYYHVHISDPRNAETVLAFFFDHPRVEWAHPVPRITASVQSAASTAKNISFPELPVGPSQDYLLPADQGGLNVVAAWDAGLSGAGQTVIDSQRNWNLEHEDLPDTSPLCANLEVELGVCPVYPGSAEDTISIQHGAANLGILGALDNGVGITGIAPAAEFRTRAAAIAVDYNTYFLTPSSTLKFILTAAEEQSLDLRGSILSFGLAIRKTADSFEMLPIESFYALFNTIEDLTAAGIVVVEGAGHGSNDLDDPSLAAWACSGTINITCPYLGPESEGGVRTDAILVGASNGADLTKYGQSNCGSRVDVFAWGQDVVTLGFGDHPISDVNDINGYYTQSFLSTSAATPQIAGISALLQEHVQNLYSEEIAKGNLVYLNSAQMRDLLKASGTPQSDNECNIGVQPDVGVAMKLLSDHTFTPTIEPDGTYCENGLTEQCLDECLTPLTTDDVSEVSGALSQTAQCGNICAFAPGSAECASWCHSVNEVDGWQYGWWNDDLPLRSVCDSVWTERTKPMDVDGDGIADLIAFDQEGTQGRFYIDRSGHNHTGSSTGFGAWDLVVDFTLEKPMLDSGDRIFPVVADYDRDGHVDLAIYNSDTGLWQVKYTKDSWLVDDLVLANFADWDLERDWSTLAPEQWEVGSRPFTGNFENGTVVELNAVTGKYEVREVVDMALVTPGGHWLISYGVNNHEAFEFDLDFVQSIGEPSTIPGWAYLPIVRPTKLKDKSSVVVPEGAVKAGEMHTISWGYTKPQSQLYSSLELADTGHQFLGGRFQGDALVSQRNPVTDEWLLADTIQNQLVNIDPVSGFGDINCHPIAADYDGDNIDDRAVLCPNGTWRIAFSSQQGSAPVEITLVPPTDALPGCIYPGGVDLQTIQDVFGTLELEKAPTGPKFASCLASGEVDPVQCLDM